MSEDVIIDFRPTVKIPIPKITPYVPFCVSEIVEDVQKTFEIGITKVHIHAGDSNTEEPTYRREVYAEIISEIRKFATDLVIYVSLSGRTFHKFEERSDILKPRRHRQLSAYDEFSRNHNWRWFRSRA